MTDQDPTKTAALYGALARAQASARAVEKDKRNAFHKYDYASAEALISESKTHLAAHSLAVIPSELLVREPMAAEAECGARAVLLSEWFVVHADGGRHVLHCQWPVIPEKGRPLDKALAAARTASLNYLLRDLLQLPRVEEGTDLDDDSRDRHSQEREPRRDPPAQTAPVVDDETRRIREAQHGCAAQLRRLGVDDKEAQKAEIRRYNGGTMPATLIQWEDVLAVLKEASPA